MRKYEANYKEKLLCRVTGESGLGLHFSSWEEPGRQWWVRIPLPGVGTEKRRVWGQFYGKDPNEVLSNALYGCGWGLDSQLEWVQRFRFDRDQKRWVEV